MLSSAWGMRCEARSGCGVLMVTRNNGVLEEGDSDTRDACRKEVGSAEGSFADVEECI